VTGEAIERTLPASDQQRDWWFREMQEPNPDLVISFRFGVAGDLRPDVLGSAVDQLVHRHGALRTSFAEQAGDVVQRVHRDVADGAFWLADLSELGEPAATARYADVVAQERGWTFDLSRPPLFRVGLLRLGGGRSVVALTVHHIVADGWAISIIMRELAALVTAADAGLRDAVAALPPAMQCADWAAAERRWAAGPEAAAQLRYWQRTLAGVRPLAVPPTRPAAEPGFRHAEVRLTADPALGERIVATARAARTFPATVALSAYLGQLSTVVRRDDVASMVMVAGRSVRGYETVVGSLTNVLTVALEDAGGRSVADLIPAVRARLLQAYAHQRLFVTRVWAGTHLDAGDVDSLFIFDDDAKPARFGPYEVVPTPAEVPRTYRRSDRWWENVKLRHGAGPSGPTVTVEYNANRYDTEFAASFGAAYLNALEKL
jgi:hypothetical protein